MRGQRCRVAQCQTPSNLLCCVAAGRRSPSQISASRTKVITKTPGNAWHDRQKRVEATLRATRARPQPASEQTSQCTAATSRRIARRRCGATTRVPTMRHALRAPHCVARRAYRRRTPSSARPPVAGGEPRTLRDKKTVDALEGDAAPRLRGDRRLLVRRRLRRRGHLGGAGRRRVVHDGVFAKCDPSLSLPTAPESWAGWKFGPAAARPRRDGARPRACGSRRLFRPVLGAFSSGRRRRLRPARRRRGGRRRAFVYQLGEWRWRSGMFEKNLFRFGSLRRAIRDQSVASSRKALTWLVHISAILTQWARKKATGTG